MGHAPIPSFASLKAFGPLFKWYNLESLHHQYNNAYLGIGPVLHFLTFV